MLKISDDAHRTEMLKRRRRQLARIPGMVRSKGGGRTPNGRNHSDGPCVRLRKKWLMAPRPDQVKLARHTHPRSKRSAKP